MSDEEEFYADMRKVTAINDEQLERLSNMIANLKKMVSEAKDPNNVGILATVAIEMIEGLCEIVDDENILLKKVLDMRGQP